MERQGAACSAVPRPSPRRRRRDGSHHRGVPLHDLVRGCDAAESVTRFALEYLQRAHAASRRGAARHARFVSTPRAISRDAMLNAIVERGETRGVGGGGLNVLRAAASPQGGGVAAGWRRRRCEAAASPRGVESRRGVSVAASPRARRLGPRARAPRSPQVPGRRRRGDRRRVLSGVAGPHRLRRRRRAGAELSTAPGSADGPAGRRAPRRSVIRGIRDGAHHEPRQLSKRRERVRERVFHPAVTRYARRAGLLPVGARRRDALRAPPRARRRPRVAQNGVPGPAPGVRALRFLVVRPARGRLRRVDAVRVLVAAARRPTPRRPRPPWVLRRRLVRPGRRLRRLGPVRRRRRRRRGPVRRRPLRLGTVRRRPLRLGAVRRRPLREETELRRALRLREPVREPVREPAAATVRRAGSGVASAWCSSSLPFSSEIVRLRPPSYLSATPTVVRRICCRPLRSAA